jgi:hypothetical protein
MVLRAKPLGRIMNRFAKDIDTIDNTLGDALRMFANTFCTHLHVISQLLTALMPGLYSEYPWCHHPDLDRPAVVLDRCLRHPRDLLLLRHLLPL